MISFGGGGGTNLKEIANRPCGHGKGEGTGVPSRAKQLFQTLIKNVVDIKFQKKFFPPSCSLLLLQYHRHA